MEAEVNFIKSLLPNHYRCTERENGVHCKSDIGISEIVDEKYFNLFVKAVEAKYDYRFIEIFHQTCTDHKEFTVYLRPQNYTPVFGYELLMVASELFPIAEELEDNSLYNEMQQRYRMDMMSKFHSLVDRNFYHKEFFKDLRQCKSSVFRFRDVSLEGLEFEYQRWLGGEL